jgi:hypothetical protein
LIKNGDANGSDTGSPEAQRLYLHQKSAAAAAILDEVIHKGVLVLKIAE